MDAEGILSIAEASLHELRQYISERTAEYPAVSLETILDKLAELEERKEKLTPESSGARIEKAHVVACTIDTFIYRLADEETFKPVQIFLDEAAYCPLIKGAILLSKKAPIVLSGDHKQLPPVCEMSESEISGTPDNWPVCFWTLSTLYLSSLVQYDMAHIIGDYRSGADPDFSFIEKYDLTYTFRFGDDLARLLDRHVYHAGLHGRENFKTELYYINAPAAPNEQRNQSSSECSAVRELVSSINCESLAILTPYRNQRELLISQLPENIKENIITIHGSQGREWDVVIISLVTKSPNPFISANLINTAISRCKKQLYIVCDTKKWSTYPNHLIGGLLSIAEPAAAV